MSWASSLLDRLDLDLHSAAERHFLEDRVDAPLARAGAGALKSGSMRTVPVKYCSGPRDEGSVPLRLSSMAIFPVDDRK